MAERSEESCDVRVWCEACKRSDYTSSGEKYLCTTCGKIIGLTHEVHHEIYPHVTNIDDMSSG